MGLGLLAGPASAAPPNDSRATPALLPGIEEVRTVDLAGATVEAGEPDHLPPAEGGSATRSVWHAWRAPADGSLLFSVGASAAASAFAVVYDPSAGFPMGGLGWALGERTAITAVSAGSTYRKIQWGQIYIFDNLSGL
ncbi:MAG: hypothetical protein JNL10_01250 [Verrucomicrobiales bacterium]|nr:hypothetical protein [Verrucomicrobiales bacterium]